MRTRFKKVWCGTCATMQFAGECPHGRVVDRVGRAVHVIGGTSVEITDIRWTLRDYEGICRLQGRQPNAGVLRVDSLEPTPARRRCSCSSCSVGAPCANLAGA